MRLSSRFLAQYLHKILRIFIGNSNYTVCKLDALSFRFSYDFK